eukprot:jgi/Mesen1/5805/ME000293S04964
MSSTRCLSRAPAVRKMKMKHTPQPAKARSRKGAQEHFRDVQGCACDVFDSPLGPVTVVASPKGLHAVLLENATLGSTGNANLTRGLQLAPDDPILKQARAQIREYFLGARTSFSLPLAPLGGTTFQQAAWRALQAIPYGSTAAYGEQAAAMGLPVGAARAVGAANGKNPLAIVVPCHRVVGKSGALTGFASGIDKKEVLLGLEARVCLAQKSAQRVKEGTLREERALPCEFIAVSASKG